MTGLYSSFTWKDHPQIILQFPHTILVSPHNFTVSPHNSTVSQHNSTVSPNISTVSQIIPQFPHTILQFPHTILQFPHTILQFPHIILQFSHIILHFQLIKRKEIPTSIPTHTNTTTGNSQQVSFIHNSAVLVAEEKYMQISRQTLFSFFQTHLFASTVHTQSEVWQYITAYINKSHDPYGTHEDQKSIDV